MSWSAGGGSDSARQRVQEGRTGRRDHRRGGDAGLEDFKAKLPIVEIVARHVRLVRRGNRHQGLCPFHQEKTPSFYVFEDQGNYHCFGCGAHGNAIDFVMALENLPFADALRRLSDLTGIPAPLREPADDASTRRQQLDPLLVANEAAREWFRAQLRTAAGRAARDYLTRRGVPLALQDQFALGYAPDSRDALVNALEAKGVPVPVQVEAGLAAQPEDGSRAYARFRHRLMFPINDMRGRVVGFGGRALGEAAKAKYLNTSETPLFHKGSLLYNLDLASRPARERKAIFIVEGYLDVIAMHEAGFENTVAPLGTAIGEEQLTLLWRHCEEPYVCLDGDAAGLNAALRTIRRALRVMQGGRTLRFVVLPVGEDPDSLIRKHGKAVLLDLIQSAVPLSMMVWQAERNAAPVDTPEQVAGLRKRLLDYVRLAVDPTLRDGLKSHFDDLVYGLRRRVGDRRGARFGADRSGGRGMAKGQRAGGWEGAARAELKASIQRAERHPFVVMLGAFLHDPSLLERYAEEFEALTLDGAADSARQEVLNWLGEGAHLDAAGLDNHLSHYGFAGLAEEARRTFVALTGSSASAGTHFAEELDLMLSRLRARLAEQLEREAFARELGNGNFDALAGRRLNRLLNGIEDDD